MTLEVQTYTDSAVVGKIVDFFSEYKGGRPAGQHFYELFWFNAVHGKEILVATELLTPIDKYLTGRSEGQIKRVFHNAIIEFLKRNRQHHLVDALLRERRLVWRFY